MSTTSTRTTDDDQQQVKHALLGALLQFAYTGVFGWFAGPYGRFRACGGLTPHTYKHTQPNSTPPPTFHTGFVLLRTAHILPCILAHAFCNLLGLPNLAPLLTPPRVLITPATVTLYRSRHVFLGLYVLGILLFALTLFPCTDPALFVGAKGRPPLYWRTR